MLVGLQISARLAVFAFVITSMLSVGLGLTLSQILEPFRSPRLVLSPPCCKLRPRAAAGLWPYENDRG